MNNKNLAKLATERDSVQISIDNLITSISNKRRTSIYKKSVDIAVITATSDEFETVKNLLEDVKELDIKNNDSVIYFQGDIKVKTKKMSVILPFQQQMGMVSVATLTTKILRFNPEYVFMLGIAAGNKKVAKIGDILIANKSVDYNALVETEKNGVNRKKFMQDADSINSNLKNKLTLFSKTDFLDSLFKEYPKQNLLKDFKKPKCLFGLLVTGSSLMRSQEKMEEIIQDYHNVVGLDMETYGMYYTCSHSLKSNPPMFVSIKSVSDFGDNTTHKLSAKDRKEYALYTSTRTFLEFIKQNL